MATVSRMATTTRDMFDAGTVDAPTAIHWLLLERQTAVEATNVWGCPSGVMYDDLRLIDADLCAIAGCSVNADAMMTAAIWRQDYAIIPAQVAGLVAR